MSLPARDEPWSQSRQSGTVSLLVEYLKVFVLTVVVFLVSQAKCLSAQVGANKLDLMIQYVPLNGPRQNAADRYIRRAMAKKAIEDGKDVGLSFFRVSITGFRPAEFGDRINDLAAWQASPDLYWKMADEMFDDLDRFGMQIVPIFVSNVAQFPVISGDTVLTYLRDGSSRSRALLANFIREFIVRYKDRHSILFYELTNELNLLADLDLRKSKCPSAGLTPCVWDNFVTSDMTKFSRELVSLVKSLDPSRKVGSGFSIPRNSAEHLRARPQFSPRGADWTPDTKDQFEAYLSSVHEPFDLVSVHIYPEAMPRFGRSPNHEWELFRDVAAISRKIGKGVFVGEFGDRGGNLTPFISTALDEIARERIEFSAIWVWEFYQTSTYQTYNTEPTQYNIEPGYSDALLTSLRSRAIAFGGRVSDESHDAPRVILTWPLPCSIIKVPTDIYAVASDGGKAVSKVEFLLDGNLFGVSVRPPYSASLDPRGHGNRSAQVEARAISSSGLVTSFNSKVMLNNANVPCSVPP
jgi:hypothetical protein